MTTAAPTPVLTTARLLLQPLQLADAEQTQQLFPQWEVVKFLNASVPWPYPPDGALSYYRDVALPAVDRGDEWYWTLRLKDQPEKLIGLIGLMKGEHTNRGFWLGLPWQGKGLMTEAVIAANDYWFDVLGFSVLRAPKAIANAESIRISQKTGMRRIHTEERDFVGGRFLAETWEMTADEWWAAREILLQQAQARGREESR
jgi:ribosomal-protein-alanine N-acetyltransferase